MATFLNRAPRPDVFVKRVRVLRAHQSFVSSIALWPGVTPMVVSGGHDGLVCVWDAREVFSCMHYDDGDDDEEAPEPLCSFELMPGRCAVQGLFGSVDLDAVVTRGVKQRLAAATMTAVLRRSTGIVVAG